MTLFWPGHLHHYDTTNRQLLRVVDLSEHVNDVYHAVETTHDRFVISRQGTLKDQWQDTLSEMFSFYHL